MRWGWFFGWRGNPFPWCRWFPWLPRWWWATPMAYYYWQQIWRMMPYYPYYWGWWTFPWLPYFYPYQSETQKGGAK